MIRIKVSAVEIDQPVSGAGALDLLKLEGFVVKKSSNTAQIEFSEENLKSNFIIISEKEFQEKLASKQGKKSNPLMVNFEEYE